MYRPGMDRVVVPMMYAMIVPHMGMERWRNRSPVRSVGIRWEMVSMLVVPTWRTSRTGVPGIETTQDSHKNPRWSVRFSYVSSGLRHTLSVERGYVRSEEQGHGRRKSEGCSNPAATTVQIHAGASAEASSRWEEVHEAGPEKLSECHERKEGYLWVLDRHKQAFQRSAMRAIRLIISGFGMTEHVRLCSNVHVGFSGIFGEPHLCQPSLLWTEPAGVVQLRRRS